MKEYSHSSNTTDLDSRLYASYVSRFKEEEIDVHPNVLLEKNLFFERNILPVLKDLNKDDAIFEIGCGSGIFISFLKTHGFTNTQGIDISAEQTGLAKTKGLKVVQGDALQYLNDTDMSFAAIVALDVIEHFNKSALLALFDAVKLRLKKGGIFIASTPNAAGLFARQIIYADLTHHTSLTPSSFAQLAQVAGLSDVSCKEIDNAFRGLKGLCRKMIWSVTRALAQCSYRAETGKRRDIWTENMLCSCRNPGDR